MMKTYLEWLAEQTDAESSMLLLFWSYAEMLKKLELGG